MRKHSALSVVLAAACTFAVSSLRAEEKWEEIPVPNASFEQGRSLPDGWQASKGNMNRPSLASVFAWDKEFARTGKRSLYIRREASGPVRWMSVTPVPITAGTAYQLRFWYRASAGRECAVGVGLYGQGKTEDGKNWEASRELPVSKVSDEWQLFTMDFTPPAGVSGVTFALANMGSGRETEPCEVWYDDVSLHRKLVP